MIWLSYRRLSACNDDDMRVITTSRLVCKCCCLAVFYPMMVRRRGVVDVSVWGWASPYQKCQYPGTILTICFHRPALASTSCTENCQKLSYQGTIRKALNRQAHTRVLWHLMMLDTNSCPRAQAEGHIHHQKQKTLSQCWKNPYQGRNKMSLWRQHSSRKYPGTRILAFHRQYRYLCSN